MGAHESPAATLAAVETDAIRLRAARLVLLYEAHEVALTNLNDGSLEDDPGGHYMDRDEWLQWEGTAYAVLKEVARG